MEDPAWPGNFGTVSTRLPGVKQQVQPHAKKSIRPATTGDLKRTTQRFDPINSLVVSDLAPALPPVFDSLNPYRRLDSKHRDLESNENKHREALIRNSHAFHRKKGGAQAYIESATRQSDMLVWQNSQSRDEATTSLLNQMSTRPKSEVYNINCNDLANTSRTASSPFMRFRHQSAHSTRIQRSIESQNLKSLTASLFSNDYNKSITSSSSVHNKNKTPSSLSLLAENSNMSKISSKGGGSLYERRVISSHSINASLLKQEETHMKLLEFERKQHQKMNFSDWTKSELIELIEAEGLEVPGEMLWDNEAGEMRKEICNKQVYVDHCKRKLFEAEPKPLVRSGKRLRVRDSYCIVDIFKAAHGAVRVQAYDDQDSREYQMLLIPNKMHELDLDPPPTTTDTKEWQLWSKLLIPRLELTDDGLLQVGEPPLQENGLPAHFTLGASSSISVKRKTNGPSSSSLHRPQLHHSSSQSIMSLNTNNNQGNERRMSNASQRSQLPSARHNHERRTSTTSRQNSSRLSINDGNSSVNTFNNSVSHYHGSHGGSSKHSKVKELPPPDRMHVTLFFRSL